MSTPDHTKDERITSNSIPGKVYISLIIFSIVLVLATVYLPKTFNDPNKLLGVACGFPSPFLTFNSSRSLPDHAWTDSCIWWLGEGWIEGNVQFLWLSFFMNVVLVFGGILGGYFLYRKGRKLVR